MSDLQEFKCPSCGGAVAFNSSLQKIECPYCNMLFESDAIQYLEDDMKKDEEDNMQWETQAGSEWESGEQDELRSYICKSCGGEIVSDENTAATSCPFCGNPVVIKDKLSGALRPDCVIPFKLDKKAAKEGLKKHLSGKRMLPKVFKSENHIDEIKGVYVPFWLFDADVDAHIRYKMSKVATWETTDFYYTEKSYYSAIREGSVGFERVPVDGCEKIPDDLMESIEPFDFADAVDFKTAYLAGYIADKYDVTAEESINRANERIKRSTEESFESTVQGYDFVTAESSSVNLLNGKTVYALYPVWLLHTTWKDKKYTFAMNGQTGKFVGDLPVNKAAYWKWVGIFTVLFSAATYGVAWLIHLL